MEYIASEYYYGIILCAEYLRVEHTSARVVIVGLGGGCLTSYITRHYKHSNITSIDIDPGMVEVAKKYFNFNTGPSSNVIVADGMQFTSEMEGQIDLLVLDVGHKDPSLSLRYPPAEFVQVETLKMWKKSLTDKGMIAINLVCRDNPQREGIIARCRELFDHCYVLNCELEINKILILSQQDIKDGLLNAGKTLQSHVNLPESDAERVYFMLSTMT